MKAAATFCARSCAEASATDACTRAGRFLHVSQMVDAVRAEMQAAYPELAETAARVAKVVRAEEERFGRTLALGSKQLDSAIERVRNEDRRPRPRVAGCHSLPSLRNLRACRWTSCSTRHSRSGHRLRSHRLRTRLADGRAGACPRFLERREPKHPQVLLFAPCPKQCFEGYRQVDLAALRSPRHRERRRWCAPAQMPAKAWRSYSITPRSTPTLAAR